MGLGGETGFKPRSFWPGVEVHKHIVLHLWFATQLLLECILGHKSSKDKLKVKLVLKVCFTLSFFFFSFLTTAMNQVWLMRKQVVFSASACKSTSLYKTSVCIDFLNRRRSPSCHQSPAPGIILQWTKSRWGRGIIFTGFVMATLLLSQLFEMEIAFCMERQSGGLWFPPAVVYSSSIPEQGWIREHGTCAHIFLLPWDLWGERAALN